MKMSGTSRCSNVATSPRRDVITSRHWVNYYAGQQAATSRRLNVVTSQRRDVRANAVFSSFKSKQEAEFEVLGNIRTKGGNQSSSDIDLEEEPVICIVTSFLTIELMFYISHISILLDSMF